MLVPLSWLKDFVTIDKPVAQVDRLLTNAGLEVKTIDTIGIPGAALEWDRELVLLAHLLKVEQHPNANKLVLATVDYGHGRSKTVVTGAPNLFQYVGQGDISGLQIFSPLMARQVADGVVPGPLPTVYGVAVDEDTALVIDPARSGRLFRQRGAGAVYVVRGGAPDRAVRGQPLVYRDLTVHKLDSDAARYDFARHCGTGRTFPLTAVGSATSYEYTPASPYAAQGNVDTCP